jgi:cytochrome c551/c552
MKHLAQTAMQKFLCRMMAGMFFASGVILPHRALAEDAVAPVDSGVAKLIEQGRCLVCHDMTKTNMLGPPFVAIATRYSQVDKEVMASVLAQKIVDGGGLNWGQMVMVQNDQRVNWQEARVIARWILDLKPSGEAAPVNEDSGAVKKREPK